MNGIPARSSFKVPILAMAAAVSSMAYEDALDRLFSLKNRQVRGDGADHMSQMPQYLKVFTKLIHISILICKNHNHNSIDTGARGTDFEIEGDSCGWNERKGQCFPSSKPYSSWKGGVLCFFLVKCFVFFYVRGCVICCIILGIYLFLCGIYSSKLWIQHWAFYITSFD